MPSIFPSGDTNVTDNATNSPTPNESAGTLPPHFIELFEKGFIIGNVAKLRFGIGILLQCPVGRGSDDQMNRLILNPGKISRITQMKTMVCSVKGLRPAFVAGIADWLAAAVLALLACCRRLEGLTHLLSSLLHYPFRSLLTELARVGNLSRKDYRQIATLTGYERHFYWGGFACRIEEFGMFGSAYEV
jgi:hypothetical protein